MVEKASRNKGSYSNRKSRGKIRKRIHKVERKKLKRAELNGLFLKLPNALEMTEQNSVKASILCETIRLLTDLLGQIECLKKEHASLLSESHYIHLWAGDIGEEKSALETEVQKLKEEKESREMVSAYLLQNHNCSRELQSLSCPSTMSFKVFKWQAVLKLPQDQVNRMRGIPPRPIHGHPSCLANQLASS